MSKAPFMPLWVSDFLGDTLDLGATEIGAYMLLLMAQWNRDGKSLPDDQQKLKRIARCGRNWPSVWGEIERFFEHDENGVYSKRLRFESRNAASKREVNARNGSRGGAAKALKNKEPALANATNSLKRNPSIPEPESENTTLSGAEALSSALCEAAGFTDETKHPNLIVLSEPFRWLETGCDLEKDILPAIRSTAAAAKARGTKITSWGYFNDPVFEARDRRLAPAPDVVPRSKPKQRESTMDKIKRLQAEGRINA